ncbi:molecular chaperone [Cupriavidus sp. L7L]|uniref:molecular chaperone n=1 Tax=Cupriavidus sp. L7L TaxID=2546443 RepID=UPI00105497D9|nr:molecular chaperone [Cupriavidus sp. L7L]TDF53924.1 molecular chaperone [Cupriavidus sp. L7L]
MTAIGIDFGTSNCSAYLPVGSTMKGIPIEGDSSLLPSVVFTARREIAIRKIEDYEYARRLKNARAAANAEQRKINQEGGTPSPINEQILRKTIEDTMRREAANEREKQYWGQSFLSMLEDGQAVLFGTPALRAHISDPLSGTLVKSPKSFIGSDIDDQYLAAFRDVVTYMLRHIVSQAERHCKQPISNAVIGRPVFYHGTMGEDGNKQALRLMEEAAKAAGLKNVEFFMEPIAAALEYEKSISREQVVLVVDIGGGTTDCAVVRLRSSSAKRFDRSSDVLGYSGNRLGGEDFDQLLAWRCFMPFLGKDRFPHSLLYDAISIRDIPAQLRFRRAEYEIELLVRRYTHVPELERFRTLHKFQLQHRVINSAELTKLKLSEVPACTVPLGYLENGLSVQVTKEEFKELSGGLLRKIENLMLQAMRGAGARPDAVFLTGGMGSSPVVQELVRSACGNDIPIKLGDMLGSVGKGLGECASLAFR